MVKVLRTTELDFIYKKDEFYRIENWYPVIKEYTFHTTWFSLSKEEGHAVSRYKEFLNYIFGAKAMEAADSDDPKMQALALEKLYTYEVFEEAQKELQQIMKEEEMKPIRELSLKIQEKINSFCGDNSSEVFVRLSSRSPKDSAFISPKTKKYIDHLIANSIHSISFDKQRGGHEEFTETEKAALELYDKQENKDISEDAENTIVFTRATWLALKISSGAEAIDLFLKSHRIQSDLTISELQQEVYSTEFILRKWENILPEFEFRVFISDGKLRGATQYYPYVFHPKLIEFQSKIKDNIEAFWALISPKILPHCSTLTLDVVFDRSFDHLTIIEINPPPPAAGGGLYDWNNENDVLQVKEGEFEVRINHQFPNNEWLLIHSPLRNFILECRANYSNTNNKFSPL